VIRAAGDLRVLRFPGVPAAADREAESRGQGECSERGGQAALHTWMIAIP
jgi:hypothetical protein